MNKLLQASIFLIVAIALFLTDAFAGATQLPDTGQTKCYQGVLPYAETDCAGTGQDGAYSINPMSYTDNGNGTITDSVTGLMWQKEVDNKDYTWEAAGTYCNSLTLGGHSDWRLPPKKELITIVDYALPFLATTINTTYFPNTTKADYWTSTTYVSRTGSAWTMSFTYGSPEYSGKTSSSRVRCVRGSQSSPAFTDNGNGTVSDNVTGLMWQKDDPGQMRWSAALYYCERLNLGGQSDWRLPNIKELESITDDGKYNPAINKTYFPNTAASTYWTSTTNYEYYAIYERSMALTVNFWSSNFSADFKSTYYGHYVRCVHSGQSGTLEKFVLTVNKSGTGSGTVTASTGTIIWNGSTGVASYSNGASIVLTATVDSGSTFTGWSGGGCSGTGTCTITINNAATVTADFTKAQTTTVSLDVTAINQCQSPYAWTDSMMRNYCAGCVPSSVAMMVDYAVRNYGGDNAGIDFVMALSDLRQTYHAYSNPNFWENVLSVFPDYPVEVYVGITSNFFSNAVSYQTKSGKQIITEWYPTHDVAGFDNTLSFIKESIDLQNPVMVETRAIDKSSNSNSYNLKTLSGGHEIVISGYESSAACTDNALNICRLIVNDTWANISNKYDINKVSGTTGYGGKSTDIVRLHSTSSPYALLINDYLVAIKSVTALSEANTCGATLSGDLKLHIPILTYNGASYYADLQYSTANSTFNLTNSGRVSDTGSYNGCTAATLSSDLKLHIPAVTYSGASYWLDLQYAGGIFTLTGAGAN